MSIEAFFLKLSEYGTAPILLVLTFAFGLLWKKVESKSEDDKKRTATLQAFLQGLINDMKKDFEERYSATNKRVDDLGAKVAGIERDYLPRDEHYRDFSGWRTELAELRNLIVSLFKEKSEK